MFLSAGLEFLEKGEFFQQIFAQFAPLKKEFSIFFTRSLHRSGHTLTGRKVTKQKKFCSAYQIANIRIFCTG